MSEEKLLVDSKTCAEISLKVYKKWKEAMRPPLFIFLPFEDWLQNIIEKEDE